MLTLQIVLAIVVLIGVILTYELLKRKNKDITQKVFITFSCVLAIIFAFRYLLGDEAIDSIFKLSNTSINSKFVNFLSMTGIWMQFIVVLSLILYPFFKNTKFDVIIRYLISIISLLNLFNIYPITLGIIGATAYSVLDARLILLAIELAISCAYAFLIWKDFGMFKLENKKDALVLLYFFGMTLATMPEYVLQGFFGEHLMAFEIKELSFVHRLIMYFSIILPFTVYLILRNKKPETIKLALLFISLGTMITFCSRYRFADWLDPTAWPFHLCHTAMFIIPICLIFKLNKVFYFTYFINVLGAFLAMAMPDLSGADNLFNPGVIYFFINHYIAFFMPLLIVMLKVYKRPKIKEFKYSMIGFGIYFVIVLIMNAWFSNYGTVDYFYINSDFIVDKLGLWAEHTRDVIWSFNIGKLKFVFYPVYQTLFFVTYVAMGAGVWFVYEAIYSFEDVVLDILRKNKKIKSDALALEVALGKGGENKPMNKELENKLVLSHFSKRYGSSDVFAVKDANLEVNCGEIFGFLGHNGAGKSTIIKSIVGIQPITEGSISVCGYDVDKQSVMAKRQIGFVPDHYALYEKLTGREYINYIADLYGVSLEDRNKAIEKYVNLFELQNAFDNQMKTYSHGMKQKITIISALVHNPKVWILDEPLTGLDPNSIFQVKECMKEHAKNGNIVFFSSHLIDVVENVCDRIAIIKKGHVLMTKTVKEIEAETTLEKFYLDAMKTKIDSAPVDEEKEKTKKQKLNKTKKPSWFSKFKKKKCETLENQPESTDKVEVETEEQPKVEEQVETTEQPKVEERKEETTEQPKEEKVEKPKKDTIKKVATKKATKTEK